MERFRDILRSNAIKRIGFAVFAQGLYALLGIIISLVLPVYMSPGEYGKWQIYFFYSAYLNFIGLGYNDGVQLQLAGKEYGRLDFGLYRTSNRLLMVYGAFVTAILISVALLLNAEYKGIYVLLFLSILPTLFFNIFNAFFVATNRSIVYNLSNFFYKLSFCVGMVMLFVCDKSDSRTVVVLDIAAKTLVTVLLLVIGYQLVVGRGSGIKAARQNIVDKSKSGMIIMATVLVSGLLPVAGRMIVEHQESIEAYGIYSFGISLLSIVLTFTSTLGIIIFPMIKKYSAEELGHNYRRLTGWYDALLFGILNFYFLGTQILTKIAPDYVSMLAYLPLLFAMCRSIGKLQLFMFPYYKYFAAERRYLCFNVIGLGVMVIGCMIGYMCANVFGVALASFVIMECFYFVVERILCKKILHIENKFDFKSIILEICFIIIGISNTDTANSFVYMAAFTVYLVIYWYEYKKSEE